MIFQLNAQNFEHPTVGAQVFIEPGQQPEEIQNWFKILQAHGMKVCRIRMFESYMRNEKGEWDFALFDYAFKAAEEHGIKVYATLFPATPFTDIGGFKFPGDKAHLQSVSEYIAAVTRHFSKYTTLYAWVLINEIGSGKIPSTPLSQELFNSWKVKNPQMTNNANGYPIMPFEDEKFLIEHNTWYLQWLADEVKKHDPQRHLHVNNHAIFDLAGEYDFSAWQSILNSLGGSAHASWHFGYFNRREYAHAMLANSEIIRSGAGKLPWIMTELQGGNNTFSGFHPMCPEPEEIIQWLWSVFITGGKSAIFWTLNPRASGIEAGEWALLDFRDQPSDRMKAAAQVSSSLQKHNEIWKEVKPLSSGIHILYTRESLWIERKSQIGAPGFPGRAPGSVMQSALGYFETISSMGMQCSISCMDEFDFSAEDYSGQAIILAHQIGIPSRHYQSLSQFVEKGGILLADGLTGFYDEHMHNAMKTEKPMQKVFGAEIKEFKFENEPFAIQFSNLTQPVPVLGWKGLLSLTHAASLAQEHDQVLATKSRYGRGSALWVPTLMGLAARTEGKEALSEWLYQELNNCIETNPVRFAHYIPEVLMTTAKTEKGFLSMVINKRITNAEVPILYNGLKGKIIFSNKEASFDDTHRLLRIHPEETVVISWEEK
ncbi:MAG: beta-galactosidase trimerization domain-containing protein [Cyclobacteriaceae bacterium]|nr:beta-galactosidase trimerization domain-containing protein [Cyclobacteriaceae bacterium]